MSNKSLAILGLILSILMCGVGLIISAIALSRFKNATDVDGKGFAIAGLIIGIILTVFSIIGTIVLINLGIGIFEFIKEYLLRSMANGNPIGNSI